MPKNMHRGSKTREGVSRAFLWCRTRNVGVTLRRRGTASMSGRVLTRRGFLATAQAADWGGDRPRCRQACRHADAGESFIRPLLRHHPRCARFRRLDAISVLRRWPEYPSNNDLQPVNGSPRKSAPRCGRGGLPSTVELRSNPRPRTARPSMTSSTTGDPNNSRGTTERWTSSSFSIS